jgi:hypothetical protein
LAFFRELIGEVFAAFDGADLDDDTMLQQTLEALGQDIGRDAFWGSEEVFETTPPENEISNNEERPAIAKDVESAGNRAG